MAAIRPEREMNIPPPTAPRRWSFRPQWRIGLRTLLIAGTAVCVGLGLWVEAGRRQRAAARMLIDRGLYVVYDVQGQEVELGARTDPTPHQYAGLGIDFWYPVVQVRSYRPQAVTEGQEILAALSRFPRLRILTVHELPLTNADLATLAALPELEALHLESSKLREGTCEALRTMKLRWLSVARTRFDDRGLAALAKMQTLQHLDLTRTKVTDAGLVHLEELRNLQRLRLNRSLVTEAGYKNLQSRLPGCDISWEPLKD